MINGYAILKNEDTKTKIKMKFYIYQGRNGGIYMNLGNYSFVLTKKQAEKMHYTIDFYEMIEDFSPEDYKKYYKKEIKWK